MESRGGHQNVQNLAPRGDPPGPPRGPPGAPARAPGRGPPRGPPRGDPHWDKHPFGCIRGHSGVSRGLPTVTPGYPQNDRFWQNRCNDKYRVWGVWGVPNISIHMAIYSAMMFVPTNVMFVLNSILSQKCKKTEKIGVPCLSRMGDLLNTRRNVQNFAPRGSRGVPPGTPPPGLVCTGRLRQ